ncbi:glycosyl hydrolase family 95 catalytic domain-containing protein [Segetibacter aerophilus]|uniref:Uncharacterized protein n=1 Tax=Segetibacter aerophilus TaxID=670293 RepID=A0A512BCJ4_9BACT|nr:glycoside hydrolase N-terminal domain-containing protein [Segetibacter aerophilus]GEO09668.1 hypothetical protein SAE01_21640 [Segetibacter aerophilus]
MAITFFPKNTKRTSCLIAALLLPLPFIGYKEIVIGKPEAKELARRHSIVCNKPAPDFFSGALLGNGGLGVVVTTRPDAIVLYFGHNNVWDVRVAENHREELKDFNYVFDKLKKVPTSIAKLTQNKWYKEYHKTASDNYNKPYPRPFPCGSVVLGFDRRKVELMGHELDISNGVCTVRLLAGKKKVFLKLMTDMNKDRLLMQLVDAGGKPEANIFTRIKVLPDPSTPAEFPHYETLNSLADGTLGFRQILPDAVGKNREVAASAEDKAFSLAVRVNSRLKKIKQINVNGGLDEMPDLESAVSATGTFSAMVSLSEGRDTNVPQKLADKTEPSHNLFTATLRQNVREWSRYWSKSSVELGDNFLEEVWYRNLYFFNCAVKDGVQSPGLFANWSYNTIGSRWHGDYHFNYNIQQPFWLTFSSNHLEKNLPYVNLVEFLMPLSRRWANEYYHLPGAAFPHTAYPVQMSMNPFPIPDWGWEISETPWAVQGLWWHYTYSGDTTFLRARAYEPIKAATQFLVAYMKRPDAYSGNRWKDDKYHIFPTVPPELHGLTPGFNYNYDCSLDLALTRFIFNAFQQATAVLKTAEQEAPLLSDITDILNNYPDYPTATSDEFGEVFVSAPKEHHDVVYNIPLSLSPVFPGEDGGLGSEKNLLQQFRNTYRNHQNEGGNDLVFLNMQAARLGLLDLDQFKRQVNYCLLPNGTAANLVSQTRGRYTDQSNFTFMADAGIWFENFALPAVINECLMQGYDGLIRLFPNWPKEKDATFNNLRAAGAFLVSASQQDEKVTGVKIISEKGNELRIINPWGTDGDVVTAAGKRAIGKSLLVLKTTPGEVILLRP